MSRVEELEMQVEELKDRLTKLSQASLRVSESLDVSTVLAEVVQNARELTGARYGVITVTEGPGRDDEVASSGLMPEEWHRLQESPAVPELYRYLRNLSEPLKVRDFAAHIRSIGIPADLADVFLAYAPFMSVPMRHRGALVGNFFLAGKEDAQEFVEEDEEVLVMFASQAATAIANASRHLDERRAKADVEALVDAAPVGVMVLDAGTGRVESHNRELQRIVGDLGKPRLSLEQLMETVTLHWVDGREMSLKEVPFTRALKAATPVRGEQIVIRVPDGRSVTILVNAAPVRGESDEVESVVVTLQDMTSLEEPERMRAEFLGKVSHELRTPLASVKGCSAILLRAWPDRDPVEALQLIRIIDEQADRMDDLISELLDAGRIETGMLSVDPVPCEMARLVDQARNTFFSGGGRNLLQIDIPRDLPRVLADRRRITQVLGNLLSNAAQHSPESSVIRVAAVRNGGHVAISVTDAGVGESAEMHSHLFRKSFRTGDASQAQGIRGAGLGLVIAKGLAEAHGGRIWAESGGPGQGTRITFTIPVAEEIEAEVAPEPAPGPAQMGRDRKRVLVVDDDPQTLRYVRHALEDAGINAVVTADPHEVPSLIETSRPHLVLLDLLLPETDGIALIKNIRALRDLPVILISGYGHEETVVRALKNGASDYVVKPFSPAELAARVKAALRSRTERLTPFTLGELTIDHEARRVTVAGRQVDLTSTEYDLLRALSLNAGRVLTHDTLLRKVWTRRSDANVRLLRTFMKQLRGKLGDDPAKPSYIFTVRGVGYRLARAGEK